MTTKRSFVSILKEVSFFTIILPVVAFCMMTVIMGPVMFRTKSEWLYIFAPSALISFVFVVAIVYYTENNSKNEKV